MQQHSWFVLIFRDYKYTMPQPMGPQEIQWMDQEAECLTYDHLVYVKTLKAASTYYSAVLRTNGWRSMQFGHIDWQHNQVFGFIMDPVTRYLKGLTEDCLDSGLAPLINDVLRLQQQQHLCLITQHTMPLSLLFGDRVYEISWIPLDLDLDPDDCLRSMLKAHGIDVLWDGGFRHQHVSDAHKQELFLHTKTMFAQGNAHFYRIFARDIDLYNDVVSRSMVSTY
jgi:hypothetical protein